jgi:hypothetical protein
VKHHQEAPEVAAPRAPQDRLRAAGYGQKAAPEPVQLGFTPGEGRHVFTSKDGTKHYMPDPVPAEFAFVAMEMFRDEGDAAASLWLVQEVFGQDGYLALRAEASTAQLEAVMEIVKTHVLGDEEGN